MGEQAAVLSEMRAGEMRSDLGLTGLPNLVSPPADELVYSYFGPQRRWAQVLMSACFLMAALSLARFASSGWYVYPLYLVLALNLIGVVLSALSGWNARRDEAGDHHVAVAEWARRVRSGELAAPSIDVFLPTCGENLEVLENTYRHVAAMVWPGKILVWVLDDGARDDVRQLAQRFGFRYIVRPDRPFLKKAGNLRNAYQQSTYDHIAIFDADFCPRPDYLFHLVCYMDAPDVGIVQSPQHFATTSSMSWLERTAGATQELFYRWVQPSRDQLGGAICVGTCAVYRRAALESAGGFAQIEHSEDVHTGIFLLRAGFRTRYVPIVVAQGLCPDDLAGFLNQQYRWCNGSITLLRSGTASVRPLTIRQRFCFWAGFMYYITTSVNVFAVHVPGVLMVLFFADEVRDSHFVPFMAGLWAYLAFMPMLSTSRWRFEVMRVQMAYSFAHALAIAHKLTGRTRGWVATGAVGRSGNSLARTISTLGLVTISVTLLLSWGGVAVRIPQYGIGQYWALVVFLTFYTYVSVPLAVEFARVLGWVRPRAATSVDRRAAGPKDNRLSWWEFIAMTSVVGLMAAVASGLLDPALSVVVGGGV